MMKFKIHNTSKLFLTILLFQSILNLDSPTGVNPEISADNKQATFYLANGTCTENITTVAPCHSWIVLHGTSLYNKGSLAFFYALFLFFLFLGIAIVSDIFMGAIEVITRYFF